MDANTREPSEEEDEYVRGLDVVLEELADILCRSGGCEDASVISRCRCEQYLRFVQARAAKAMLEMEQEGRPRNDSISASTGGGLARLGAS